MNQNLDERILNGISGFRCLIGQDELRFLSAPSSPRWVEECIIGKSLIQLRTDTRRVITPQPRNTESHILKRWRAIASTIFCKESSSERETLHLPSNPPGSNAAHMHPRSVLIR